MSYLSKIKLPNNNEYFLRDKEAHWYGTVDTAAATAAKSTTITGLTPTIGSKIILTFTYGNTAAAPTLSVNGTAAIPFYLNHGNAALWDAEETCEFIYDGTYWNLINYGKIEVIRL